MRLLIFFIIAFFYRFFVRPFVELGPPVQKYLSQLTRIAQSEQRGPPPRPRQKRFYDVSAYADQFQRGLSTPLPVDIIAKIFAHVTPVVPYDKIYRGLRFKIVSPSRATTLIKDQSVRKFTVQRRKLVKKKVSCIVDEYRPLRKFYLNPDEFVSLHCQGFETFTSRIIYSESTWNRNEIAPDVFLEGQVLDQSEEGIRNNLLIACQHGDVDLARIILDNAPSGFINTELTQWGSLGSVYPIDTVYHRHSSGEDTFAPNRPEATPVIWSQVYGHNDLTAFLLTRGATQLDLFYPDDPIVNNQAVLIQDVALCEWAEIQNYYGLVSAAGGGLAGLVRAMISVDSGPQGSFVLPPYIVHELDDVQLIDGAVVDAFYAAIEEGHTQVVQYFLTHGINPRLIDRLDPLRRTPLMTAAYFGRYETCALLLTHDSADLDLVNYKQPATGRSALSEAVRQGHLHIVELLLRNSADITSAESDGATVLIIAASLGHVQTVKYLVHSGANVVSEDLHGLNALHHVDGRFLQHVYAGRGVRIGTGQQGIWLHEIQAPMENYVAIDFILRKKMDSVTHTIAPQLVFVAPAHVRDGSTTTGLQVANMVDHIVAANENVHDDLTQHARDLMFPNGRIEHDMLIALSKFGIDSDGDDDGFSDLAQMFGVIYCSN